MSLETAIQDEAQQTRVVVRGQASLGQLASLMRVLEVDCSSWRHHRVLLDFTGLEASLAAIEQTLLEQIAAARLRKKQLAVLWP